MRTEHLVGREMALDVLSSALTSGVDRGDHAILLVGEPGIGKSACLRAAEVFARAAGRQLLDTVGSEAESALPFAGLQRLLRPLLGRADALPTVQRRALLTALGSDDGPRPDLFVVALAALGLVNETCERRALLIVVDDLQWIDEASRRVLTFLARRLDRGRVVILAAAAWVRGAPEVADAFQELRLDRLGETAAHRLLGLLAPDLDDTRREWVVGEAGGNPLALVELAAVARSVDMPRTDPFSVIVPLTEPLRRAFGGRLHELPAASRDAVLVAALASGTSLQEILTATALLTGRPVTPAVLEAPQRLGVLRFDDTSVHFAHPLVRSAVAQSESVSRRQATHAALGDAVTVSSHRRTWHRANGVVDRDDTIAADLELLSVDSLRSGDTAGAVMALQRAAQLSTAPTDRGRRLLLAAKYAADIAHFDVVDRLLGIAMGDELSEFDRLRAELLREDLDGVRVGGSARVLHLCAVAARAATAGEHGLALELAFQVGLRSFPAQLDPRAALAVACLLDTVAADRGDPRALATLALVDPVGRGREVVSTLASTDVETREGTDALRALAVAACSVGDHVRGSDLLDQAETALRRSGMHGALAQVLRLSADVRLDIGDWGRAARALTELGSLTAGSRHTVPRAEVLATAAKDAALRGDTASALSLVVEVEHAPGRHGGSSDLARAQIARGIAYLSAGRHLDAYSALSRVFDPDDPSHHHREQCSAVVYLAEAADRSGQHDPARTLLQRMEVLATATGSPLLHAQLPYARAVLAGDDVAEQLFVDALASGSAGSSWMRARTQLAFGRWLRRHRRVSRSRGPLREAHVTLRELGATRWAEEALDELEATGDRSVDLAAGSPAASLSSQELKIARLVAQGLSNGEIGQQLGLSPRTVGSHLYRIFPKLDVSARGQIAARLVTRERTDPVRT